VILKLIANKWMLVAVGSVATVFIGLAVGLWYQAGQIDKMRTAAAITSAALAQEISQTNHLRTVIENQNVRIASITEEAKRREFDANKRVNQLLKERSKLIMESEKLQSGHLEMNKWLREQF